METKNTDEYRKMQIEAADPASLILMLYDRAIFLIEKAKNDIIEKQYEEKNVSLTKATDIVFELLMSLDKDKGGVIATSLTRLYNFVIRELTDANTTLNTKALDNVKRILSELRDAWESIKNDPNVAANNTNNTITNIDLSG
jgi:flagellar protein FliS